MDLLGLQESLSGDSLEVRAELAAAGELYARESKRILGAASPSEEQPPARAPLTIYFSQPGEALWDIAKRYRTTVDSIRRENELSDAAAADGQMLLIPSA
jgi:LysM repeat protein